MDNDGKAHDTVALRRDAGVAETARANRTWWDAEAGDYYVEHGQMLPDDWFEQLRPFDAIFFGAVGWPDVVPDHVSLWGSLLKFRRDGGVEDDEATTGQQAGGDRAFRGILANGHDGGIAVARIVRAVDLVEAQV